MSKIWLVEQRVAPALLKEGEMSSVVPTAWLRKRKRTDKLLLAKDPVVEMVRTGGKTRPRLHELDFKGDLEKGGL